MRDEDHRGALGRQLLQRGEELIHFLGHEDGRRLVEDDDPGAAVEHLQDLDALALAHAQLVDELIGGDVETEEGREVADLLAGLADVEPERRPGLVAEHHVLPHREVVGQHEVLEDHADPRRDGVAERVELALHPVHHDGALVGPLGTVERLHQRGLARAVLAHDGVHGARPHREVDAVVGHHAGEPLDDAAELDGDRTRRRLGHSRSSTTKRGVPGATPSTPLVVMAVATTCSGR